MESEKYFNQVYDADLMNQKIQSRDEYLQWATGKDGCATSEWEKLINKTVEGLNSDSVKRIRFEMENLGQRAIGEWAKHNSIRAVDSEDLEKWGDLIAKTRSSDQQFGLRVADILAQISTELSIKITNRGIPVI